MLLADFLSADSVICNNFWLPKEVQQHAHAVVGNIIQGLAEIQQSLQQ